MQHLTWEALAGFALLAALPATAALMGAWIRRIRGPGAWKVTVPATLIGLAATVSLAAAAWRATGDPTADRIYLASPLAAFLLGLTLGRRRHPRRARGHTWPATFTD